MALELNKDQRLAINRYLEILQQKYGEQISEVILFGSIARGDYTGESDIDLLVVTVDGGQKLKDDISMSCFDIILETDVILSPMVMDAETYKWHEKYEDPLYNHIKRDGLKLWRKKPEFL